MYDRCHCCVLPGVVLIVSAVRWCKTPWTYVYTCGEMQANDGPSSYVALFSFLSPVGIYFLRAIGGVYDNLRSSCVCVLLANTIKYLPGYLFAPHNGDVLSRNRLLTKELLHVWSWCILVRVQGGAVFTLVATCCGGRESSCFVRRPGYLGSYKSI